MTDNEFTLADRVAKIKSIQEQHDINANGYISFSGGKDSTVLSRLIDEALPSNTIPRVFFNTGIEISKTLDFVKRMQERDSRVVIFNSGVDIKAMLEKEGYPMHSKKFSQRLCSWQNGRVRRDVDYYLHKRTFIGKNGEELPSRYCCPERLLYAFTDKFTLKVSDKCCTRLKKDTARRYERESGRYCAIIGIRVEEGGVRAISYRGKCVIFDKSNKDKIKIFAPLSPVSNDFIEYCIKHFSIELSELYYKPFSFNRTGCCCCPMTSSRSLRKELRLLKQYSPQDYNTAIRLWKPVYDEYVKAGLMEEKDI